MVEIYIESYGCAANQNDAEIMKGLLVKKGFSIVDNEKFADIVILNTCVVKGPTLKKMENRIKHFARKKLIVSGCMPEILSGRIKKFAPNASFFSTHYTKDVVKVVKNVVKGKKIELIGKKKQEKLCSHKIPNNKIIGITQLSQGCINDCSYCLVHLVKGSLFSYSQQNILKDIKQNLRFGCKEIWLTSQDNACYGVDRGKNELPILIKKILALKGRFFIRLGMMNPSSLIPIVDDIIRCYKNKKMFKFLHLPIQSGSDNVLRLMNRKYKTKDFVAIINKFRKEIPNLILSTDIIVGFPSETKKDFTETIKFVKQIRPDIINISKFWPMPYTRAAKMKQIPLNEIKKRTIKLMKLHHKIAIEKNKKMIGQKTRVFIDARSFNGSFLGRLNNYKLVVIMGKNLLGKIIDVKIIRATSHYLVAKLLKSEKK